MLYDKLYASYTPASDLSTHYLGTKSHRYSIVCEKKTKKYECKLFSANPVHKFFKYIIILYEKARACHFHFVGKDLKDSDLYKHSFREIVGTKSLSSAELIEQLRNFRKLFLRCENNRINFENDSLSDDNCCNLTGKSQSEKLCSNQLLLCAKRRM